MAFRGGQGVERMPSNNTQEWELADIIRLVCSRPKMYFGGGSFRCGAAFFDGFALGRGEEVRRQLSLFGYWLIEHVDAVRDLPGNLSWSWIYKTIYPEDETAFAELPRLFDQFLQEVDTLTHREATQEMPRKIEINIPEEGE